MKQEGLQYFKDTYLIILGLMIFLGYFIFMAIQTARIKKNKIDHLQNIPFGNED